MLKVLISSYVIGRGIFRGYHNRDDLTEKVLIEYDGLECYQTEDFGRLNIRTGEMEYVGRRYHQIKIRGQRIELDEIELLSISK
jgi:non-ribosomal peptide synthetase component F